MNPKKIVAAFTLFLIISSLTAINACSERNETVSCFPNSVVSVQLNLNLPTYYKLQTVGSWVYVNEVGAGTNGLIVYRASSGFMIYDRNAPHICPESDTVLEVKDGTRIICPHDGAEWFLTTGQPLNSTAKTALKTYRSYSYDANSNVLSIYN